MSRQTAGSGKCTMMLMVRAVAYISISDYNIIGVLFFQILA